MLQKFDNKSERVKGLSFHPRRPWLLASLHNGVIQLFDYRSRVLVDKFEEHQGPVRGICFHNSQPLFVSGGDDYKIKVWNYKQRKCLFTLHGHLDYIRTVAFHHESPWIVSASDDQTIRIWNWQSRNCISILTGHNHYVMCAQFHPKDPLLVSASLDQTVRVWDISGLKSKNTKPTPATQKPTTFEEISRQGNDLFNNNDAIVKYVLEGHDRGVNWASFHPTLPLIVSGSDDRQVKIWRMSDTKAWEVDSLRGHHNFVSCVIFHPKQELIMSVSEDKSIRVWDIAKRQAISVFKSENDRFWVLKPHPELNLFAAGHDNGFILFKLERERPAYAIHENTVYYVKEKFIRAYDCGSGNDVPVATVKRTTGLNCSPKFMAFNPAEGYFLITSANGNVELIGLGGDPVSGGSSGESRSFPGLAAVFVARNRYAILDSSSEATGISYAGTAHVLLTGPSAVKLFDIQQMTTVSELAINNIKYTFWSDDMSQVALVSKTVIYLATKKLLQKSMIVETSSIKSGAFDENGVFIYSTLTHLKYALPQGDSGIIKTIDQPLYVIRAKGNSVVCLDRDGKVRMVTIDPAEYRFKLALIRKQYDSVLEMIRTSNLVGQSVIAYLRKKGYPEVALMFVKDPKARFELAVECGNLEIALEATRAINKDEFWLALAEEGLKQGNHAVVELAYQNTRNFDRLSFLYLILGNGDKLLKMQKIAEARSDISSLFHNALYTGNIDIQFSIYMATGQFGLAYLLAKTYGLERSKIEAAISAAGHDGVTLNESTVDSSYPCPKRLLCPPVPAYKTYQENWPMASLSRGLFDSTVKHDPLVEDDPSSVGKNEFVDALDEMDHHSPSNNPTSYGNQNTNNNVSGGIFGTTKTDGAEAAGWDIADDDLKIELEEDDLIPTDSPSNLGGGGGNARGTYIFPTVVSSLENLNVSGFLRKTRVPSHHFVFGSFENALQILHSNFGIVNFSSELKANAMKLYESNKVVVPSAVAGAPGLLASQIGGAGNEVIKVERVNALVAQVIGDLETLEKGVSLGLQHTTQGRFSEAIEVFRRVLQMIPFVAISKGGEISKIAESLIPLLRGYVLGLEMETERKALQPDSLGPRGVELAWQFTAIPALQAVHLKLALRSAMAINYKAGNYKSAGHFARRLLELDAQDQVALQARKIVAFSEKKNEDAIPVPLVLESPDSLEIDSLTLKTLESGRRSSNKFVYCGLCGSATLAQGKGKSCTVCKLSHYGWESSEAYAQNLIQTIQTSSQ